MYAGDLVLMSKEEAVLQGMTERLIEAGIYYGMEMNLEKNEGNENLKATIPSTECDKYKNLRIWNINTLWVT